MLGVRGQEDQSVHAPRSDVHYDRIVIVVCGQVVTELLVKLVFRNRYEFLFSHGILIIGFIL